MLFSGKNKKNIINLSSAEWFKLNIDNFFNVGPILMKFSPKCRVWCLELTEASRQLKRQKGGRNGQEGRPTPLYRASWSTVAEMTMFKVQRAITPKVGKSELRFMCSARRLIMLYICVKFRENITNGIRVMERTRVPGRNGYVQCSKGNNSISRQSELRFMCSTYRLMVVYIGVKFRENISNGFRVMERTRNYEALTDGHSKFRTV